MKEKIRDWFVATEMWMRRKLGLRFAANVVMQGPRLWRRIPFTSLWRPEFR